MGVLIVASSWAGELGSTPPQSFEAVSIDVVDAAWSRVTRGGRAALVATEGEGGTARSVTVVNRCAEVLDAQPAAPRGSVSLSLSAPEAARVRALQPDARMRLAVCARPDDDRRILPLPPGSPEVLRRVVLSGDRVDVLVGIRRAPPAEDETVTLLVDVAVHDGADALVMSAEQAEKYAHSLDVGAVALSLRPAVPADPHAPRRMAEMIPSGLRLAAVSVPPERALAPFLAPGDYVDALVVVGDRAVTFLQGVFTFEPSRHADRDSALLVLVTPEQAEQWMHAARFTSMGYSLRHPADVTWVDPAATPAPPGPQPPLDTAGTPSARVARGRRGVVLDVSDRSLSPGESSGEVASATESRDCRGLPGDGESSGGGVGGGAPDPTPAGMGCSSVRSAADAQLASVRASGCPEGDRSVPLERALVLGIAAGSGGDRALVQVTPAEALLVLRAMTECRSVTASTDTTR